MSAGIIGGPSPETSCTPPMLSCASLHTSLGPCNGNARFVPPRPNDCFDTILAEIVEAGFGVVCSVNPPSTPESDLSSRSWRSAHRQLGAGHPVDLVRIVRQFHRRHIRLQLFNFQTVRHLQCRMIPVIQIDRYVAFRVSLSSVYGRNGWPGRSDIDSCD